jgi:bacterioferritin
VVIQQREAGNPACHSILADRIVCVTLSKDRFPRRERILQEGGKTAMATNHDIINELRKSYAMELETVQNYLANAIDLDGVRAEEIKKALLSDIEEELGHARKLGNRIKVLEGRVPGSLDLDRTQRFLQPPKDSTNVIAVIRGVIRAEDEAIDEYKKIIRCVTRLIW